MSKRFFLHLPKVATGEFLFILFVTGLMKNPSFIHIFSSYLIFEHSHASINSFPSLFFGWLHDISLTRVKLSPDPIFPHFLRGVVCPTGENGLPSPQSRNQKHCSSHTCKYIAREVINLIREANTRARGIYAYSRHITISSAQHPGYSPRFLQLCFHRSIRLILKRQPPHTVLLNRAVHCYTSCSMTFPPRLLLFKRTVSRPPSLSVMTGNHALITSLLPPVFCVRLIQ
jgi:hypothetical protein